MDVTEKSQFCKFVIYIVIWCLIMLLLLFSVNVAVTVLSLAIKRFWASSRHTI